MLSDRTDTIWIVSTRDPDRQPVCKLRWGPEEWYAPVADVRETALDLLECAVYAQQLILLHTRVGLPPHVISEFIGDLAGQHRPPGKRFFGAKSTITLAPGGSTKRRESVVMLKRGSKNGAISPAEAREMAQVWLTAAEATQSDQLVTEALTNIGRVDEEWVEGFFGYLQQLRDGGDKLVDDIMRAAEAGNDEPGQTPTAGDS